MPQRHTVSSDRQAVLQLLLNLEFEVNDYDREIVKHRAAIALLEKRKGGAVKTMANLRTFLSPIHKLPPEVLTRIFVESVDFPDRDYSKRRRMPLILTKVCRRWRDVSVAYPALWSKFLVLEDDWGTSGHVDIINCYMKRSQQYPLTINLELPTVDSLTYVQEDDYLRPGLAALVPHSPRWQRLTISGYPIWLLDHPIFETIKGRLPQLEHLEIRQEYCSGEGASDDYDVFSDCPQLKAITTEWPSSHAPMVGPSLLEVIRVPWVQLRSCTVGVGELTTLLSLPCGGLEHLCIEDCEGDDPEDMSGNQKLVSNVSSLKFEGCGEALLNLLNHLSFPRVSSLDILYKPRVLTPLVECIAQPSSTSLTSLVLDLHSDCKTDAELVSLLRHTPMVHTLSVRTFSWSTEVLSEEFFGNLTLSHERFPVPNPLLPALENFILWPRPHPQAVDQELIIDALASRWLPDPDYAKLVGAACLRNVTIKLRQSQVGETFFSLDMPALQDLQAAGMRIDVVSPTYF